MLNKTIKNNFSKSINEILKENNISPMKKVSLSLYNNYLEMRQFKETDITKRDILSSEIPIKHKISLICYFDMYLCLEDVTYILEIKRFKDKLDKNTIVKYDPIYNSELFIRNVSSNDRGYYFKKDLSTEEEFLDFLNEGSTPSEYFNNDTFNDGQRDAIKAIGEGTNRTYFVSAPAGSGKTYMINLGLKNFMFIAPTNAAASLVSGGMTIHSAYYKILNIIKKQGHFTLKENYIVIDEVSMLSIEHINMLNFIFEKASNAKIIFLGDENQLEPIGRGKAIQYILQSSAKVLYLNQNMRSRNNLNLALLQNHMVTVMQQNNPSLSYDQIIRMAEVSGGANLISYDEMYKVISNPENVGITFKNADRMLHNAILSKGLSGIDLNYTNDRKEVTLADKISNYDKHVVFEGLIRVINKTIRRKDGDRVNIVAFSSDRYEVVEWNNDDLMDTIKKPYDWQDVQVMRKQGLTVTLKNVRNAKDVITLSYSEYVENTSIGYIITVHKSQGQTFKKVVYFQEQHSEYLKLNLIYTAITRASHNLYLINKNKLTSKMNKSSMINTAVGV